MKINRYGVVILTEGNPRVEGWLVERESDDPEDATTEQLLLGFAIHWAKERFDAALNSASMNALRDMVKKKIEDQKAN